MKLKTIRDNVDRQVHLPVVLELEERSRLEREHVWVRTIVWGWISATGSRYPKKKGGPEPWDLVPFK